jgi:hypothetical protein
MRGGLRDDHGSVMLLGIGLVAICLLGAVVLVDASAAFLQRRQLLALADSAALAGAQSIDRAAYYAEGATDRTRLDPAAVPVRVRGYLARTGEPGDVTLEAVHSDGRRVWVTLSSPMELPFLASALAGRITVQAAAQLAYRGSGPESGPYP